MMTAPTQAPNVDVSMAARQYVSAGWSLVPIAKGSKGPRHTGWNERAQCIDDEQRAGKVRGGIGLAHAYSGTACVDLDDLAKCRDWFLDEHLIDLDGLMEAADAVQIVSGRPNRGKLLYRLPEGVEPLVTVKVKEAGLELRCATREGKTVQDVLPPTIHPETLLPYQWAGAGKWHALPVLPPEILEVWNILAKEVTPVRESAGVPDGNPEDDPMVKHLDAGGWVKAKLRDGTRHIRCPFQAEHTDAGAKDTVGDCSYFPAMTGGYAQGHFRCLHAHCEHRTDAEFIDGVGYDHHAVVAEQFDIVTDVAPTPSAVVDARRALERDKQGKARATLLNLSLVLDEAVCRVAIARDTFRDTVMWSPSGTNEWRPFKDSDYTTLRMQFEREYRFLPIGKEMIRDAVEHKADMCQFDSAQLWLDGLQWDGVERIGRFLSTHFGADDTPYTEAASIYFWTAMAGRVIEPGVKADMVLIASGPQGYQKSSGILALVPAPEHYAEVDFAADEDAIARKLRGTLVAEFAELKGLRNKEMEHVKAFITRQYENWTPKFKEFNQIYARRTIFIGTTNEDEFLADATGNRRWLPFRVRRPVDLDAIRRDRDQLWAEAAATFMLDGIAWRDAERLGQEVHEEHLMSDPWEESIEQWINEPIEFGGDLRKIAGFKMGELLHGALAINSKDHRKIDEMRAGAILRKFGLQRKTSRRNGCLGKFWSVTAGASGGSLKGNSEVPF